MLAFDKAKGHHSALLKQGCHTMLHAFHQRKSHLYKRYLGHREIGEKRVCEEDEITALIMGPLDYMPASAVELFWRGLVERPGHGVSPAFPFGPASYVKMRFWPRRGIEPDLVVELEWPSGERRILLVEFKWNSPLSGECQLQRQWLEYLTEAERKNAYHLFIAPDISSGLNAVSSHDVWKGQLILHSWFSVLNSLRHIGIEFAGLQTWIRQTTAFLDKLGIVRFQGFHGLGNPPTTLRSPVFWRPVGDFHEIAAPSFPANPITPLHCFWNPTP
ncbi:hypothetical protein [Pseudomonas moraviensis]